MTRETIDAMIRSLKIVEAIEYIFTNYGEDVYLGEDVTIAEHMLQTAKTAEERGGDTLDIVGALLHDIGHYLSPLEENCHNPDHDREHEKVGSDVLKRFFPIQVVDIVRYHVSAKRYLCTVEPSYCKKLSVASMHSFILQGGYMSQKEIETFEANPNIKRILFMRRCEDVSKRIGEKTHPFSYYIPLLKNVVNSFAKEQKII